MTEAVTTTIVRGKGRPRKRLFSSSSSDEEQLSEDAQPQALARIRNNDRIQSHTDNQLGKNISTFPENLKLSRDNLPINPNRVKTPYDYMKHFISDDFANKDVKETKGGMLLNFYCT